MDKPHVIAISFAKKALEQSSRDRERMREYASVLGSYTVIVFTKKEEGFPVKQEEGNLTLYATNARTKLGQVIVARRIARTVVANNKDKTIVVSSQDPFVSGLVAKATTMFFKHAKLHIQVHGDVFNKLFFQNKFTGACKRMLARILLKQAAGVRVVSERIKESLIDQGIKETKITVLPIQPEPERFLAVGKNREYSHSSIVKLLYVGRFSQEKNIPLLLQAVADARTKGAACQLTLVGSGPEQQTYENLVKELGLEEQFLVKQWTNDIPACMGDADVFCLASDHEGYGLVLVEAMAAGLPVVTTDVGCAGELVKDKEQGIVTPVRDVYAYSDAVLALTQNHDLRERLGRNGYKAAEALSESREIFLQKINQSFNLV